MSVYGLLTVDGCVWMGGGGKHERSRQEKVMGWGGGVGGGW